MNSDTPIGFDSVAAFITSKVIPKITYSPEQIEQLKEELYNKAKELRTKELPSDCFSLIIDAYHTEIKDEEVKRLRKAVIYICIGIDMELKKDFFRYWIFFGSKKKGEGD